MQLAHCAEKKKPAHRENMFFVQPLQDFSPRPSHDREFCIQRNGLLATESSEKRMKLHNCIRNVSSDQYCITDVIASLYGSFRLRIGIVKSKLHIRVQFSTALVHTNQNALNYVLTFRSLLFTVIHT